MISIELSSTPDPKWNDRLSTSPFATIYHTKEYASVQNDLGNVPIFIKFLDNTGSIVAQMVITKRLSGTKKSLIHSLKTKVFQKKYVLNWIYGPIVLNKEYLNEIKNEFFRYLVSANQSVSGSEHPLSPNIFSKNEKKIKIQKWGTFLIDLNNDLDSLWLKMEKHSVRKNIERAEKKQVYIKQITRSNLKLYQAIREENKPVPLSVLENRWDKLSNVGWTGFLAFHEEKPIGGFMISYYNNYINEFGIARTKKDFNEKLYAQDLLKWNVIKWGVSERMKYYDLTGVNPEPSNDKESGIFRYKKKWGGQFHNYLKINSY